MNILIVGPSWVGDTVISQVLLQLLKQQHPACGADTALIVRHFHACLPWTVAFFQSLRCRW